MASVTIADLQQVLSVFDTASTRGAFRGHELASVGSLYNKIAEFINEAAEQSKNLINPPESK